MKDLGVYMCVLTATTILVVRTTGRIQLVHIAMRTASRSAVTWRESATPLYRFSDPVGRSVFYMPLLLYCRVRYNCNSALSISRTHLVPVVTHSVTSVIFCEVKLRRCYAYGLCLWAEIINTLTHDVAELAIKNNTA